MVECTQSFCQEHLKSYLVKLNVATVDRVQQLIQSRTLTTPLTVTADQTVTTLVTLNVSIDWGTVAPAFLWLCTWHLELTCNPYNLPVSVPLSWRTKSLSCHWLPHWQLCFRTSSSAMCDRHRWQINCEWFLYTQASELTQTIQHLYRQKGK